MTSDVRLHLRAVIVSSPGVLVIEDDFIQV